MESLRSLKSAISFGGIKSSTISTSAILGLHEDRLKKVKRTYEKRLVASRVVHAFVFTIIILLFLANFLCEIPFTFKDPPGNIHHKWYETLTVLTIDMIVILVAAAGFYIFVWRPKNSLVKWNLVTQILLFVLSFISVLSIVFPRIVLKDLVEWNERTENSTTDTSGHFHFHEPTYTVPRVVAASSFVLVFGHLFFLCSLIYYSYIKTFLENLTTSEEDFLKRLMSNLKVSSGNRTEEVGTSSLGTRIGIGIRGPLSSQVDQLSSDLKTGTFFLKQPLFESLNYKKPLIHSNKNK